LYYDEIFDNNTVVIEMVAQLSLSAVPGSQHNILVTVDYGMDGVDYMNNVVVNATAPETPAFNAVSRILCEIVRRIGSTSRLVDPSFIILIPSSSQLHGCVSGKGL